MDHHFPPANPADAQYYNYPTPQPQGLMEVDTIVSLIERIGLPAVIIGACMFYIWKSQLAHREEIKEWNQNNDNKYNLENIKNEKVLKNMCTLINFYKKEGISPFAHIDINDEEGLMGAIIENMYEKEKVFWMLIYIIGIIY